MLLEAHSTLEISSGAICFGQPHNIYSGALVPVQHGIPSTAPQRKGTVAVQQMEYNLAAKNGLWKVYCLVEIHSQQPAAWFVAHPDVNPAQEVDKILRVFGSPYEEDSGSRWNDEAAAAEGIFGVNRYDWDYYDKRSWNHLYGDVIEEIDSADSNYHASTCGIADFSRAKEIALQWKDSPPRQRTSSADAVWFCLPKHEYMFGRFSFDEDRAAVQSFLFFSTNTDFTRTAFSGSEVSLRKFETPEELFQRRLQEGYDFSGINERSFQKTYKFFGSERVECDACPPDDKLFGPYTQDEQIFTPDEVEAIRVYLCSKVTRKARPGREDFILSVRVPEFAESWKASSLTLLNELALSYIEHSVVPCLGSGYVLATANCLYPEDRDIDKKCYHYFTTPSPDTARGLDFQEVGARIRKFWNARGTASFTDEIATGTARALYYLISEVLEAAGSFGVHPKIVPMDIRIALVYGPLLEKLQFSRFLWKGL